MHTKESKKTMKSSAIGGTASLKASCDAGFADHSRCQ